ncbi:uncharacterized protein FFB20_05299 [Fusarium fujikuroi]|uniref:Uncharacterized protein n=1 Tax=Gibberella fujikuroi (strain CBS 195.34 / IMI 58289 / NRRL A-6831) TaxID=1279085 RepID=S0E6N4_GIBF5|nr:uncharacterized protein FFUJ_06315 [Fusarium fujikuroi IMI 58289]SCN76499.1 uncharacterized protein FFB20_05299 [Fusarium fujikuroi]CCT70350.1 uncharacterized protein FFUJ_06315 [Fusarium fujikuroi IMI 58289]SCN81745.1 uncharacterized protein FFE2_04744 [Fusarium fujikuroi]SCN84251.1 uncharacterized protein FFM5_03289 [Fusarium fujikuroi]SCN85341.1 uncharacterized protein FFC1_04847 [Fusarium fujikuroi]
MSPRDSGNSLINRSTLLCSSPGQRSTVPVLDLRTARDHRLGFDDVRCISRIAQAINELVGLVGISIEFKVDGNPQSKYADRARLLTQDLVGTNPRDVRLVAGDGGVVARKELLLTLMKMCVPHKLGAPILITALASSTSWHPFLTLRPRPAICAGNGWGRFVGGHLTPRLDVFDICHYEFRFLQQSVLVNIIKPNSAVRIGEPSNHLGLYHLNINDIFHKDYGATQINFVKFLVVDMMGYLPQLDEMCILPNGQHFNTENQCWETAPST